VFDINWIDNKKVW